MLNGINFRFIDTAGLRETKDSIERLGIERAYAQIRKASVILLLIDLSESKPAAVLTQIEKFRSQALNETQTLIPVFNKLDEVKNADFEELKGKGVFISAKNNWHLDELIERLSAEVEGYGQTNETIVTNVRHYEILKNANYHSNAFKKALKIKFPAIYSPWTSAKPCTTREITGQITSDDLLGNIFANFCIGK